MTWQNFDHDTKTNIPDSDMGVFDCVLENWMDDQLSDEVATSRYKTKLVNDVLDTMLVSNLSPFVAVNFIREIMKLNINMERLRVLKNERQH